MVYQNPKSNWSFQYTSCIIHHNPKHSWSSLDIIYHIPERKWLEVYITIRNTLLITIAHNTSQIKAVLVIINTHYISQSGADVYWSSVYITIRSTYTINMHYESQSREQLIIKQTLRTTIQSITAHLYTSHNPKHNPSSARTMHYSSGNNWS